MNKILRKNNKLKTIQGYNNWQNNIHFTQYCDQINIIKKFNRERKTIKKKINYRNGVWIIQSCEDKKL